MQIYRKKGVQPMVPWVEGMDLTGVSIGPDDVANGSPQTGDMIAHDPDNLADKWLINAKFHTDKYEEVLASAPPVPGATPELQMKYFVLKPRGTSPYHVASRAALRAYADSILPANPQLSQEIHDWVKEMVG